MLHALLMSNLDCFKLFAQVSIVLICGINLPNRLCPRSEWHIIMFSGFYLDIEEVAVPAKCLSPIMYITLKVEGENILKTRALLRLERTMNLFGGRGGRGKGGR